jgi:hypothetical protein
LKKFDYQITEAAGKSERFKDQFHPLLLFAKLKNNLDHICDMSEAIVHPKTGFYHKNSLGKNLVYSQETF